MKKLVVYFTKTGKSKRMAEKIAGETGAELVVLTDDKNWSGILGFIRGGYYAVKLKETTPILTPQVQLTEYDKVVVLTPMWAGHTPPAVTAFLRKHKPEVRELHLVINSGGVPPAGGLDGIREKICNPDVLYSSANSAKDEDAVIASVIRAF